MKATYIGDREEEEASLGSRVLRDLAPSLESATGGDAVPDSQGVTLDAPANSEDAIEGAIARGLMSAVRRDRIMITSSGEFLTGGVHKPL